MVKIAESLPGGSAENFRVPFGQELFVDLGPTVDVSPAACVQGLYTPENGVDPGSGNNDDWNIIIDNFLDTSEPAKLN